MTKTRTPHTCQYHQPCKACEAAGRLPIVSSEAFAAIRKAMERTRNYRSQEHIESVKLPFHGPGADAYGPNGEQRFFSRNAYKEAGRRNGQIWQ